MELSESIYEYVDRKIGELDKFIQNVGDAPGDGERDPIQVDVEVARTTNHHNKGDVYRAEVNMTLPGKKNIVRATSEQHDLHVAIDEVKEEMQRQLKKYKGKRETRFYRSMRKIKRATKLSKLARRKEDKV